MIQSVRLRRPHRHPKGLPFNMAQHYAARAGGGGNPYFNLLGCTQNGISAVPGQAEPGCVTPGYLSPGYIY